MSNSTVGEKFREMPRILFAEDRFSIREVLLNFLDGAGYRVDTVGDGSLAVDYFRKHEYNLVLMDIEMPVMDGYQASRAIREIKGETSWRSNIVPRHRVPIIAITAFPESSIKEEYFQAGMDDYLCEPFMREELLCKLEKWLSLQRE